MELPNPIEHDNILSTINKAVASGILSELMGQEFYLAYLEIVEEELMAANGIELPEQALFIPNYQHQSRN